MRVVYLTSEKFMLDFISAIQKNRSTDFVNNQTVDKILTNQFFNLSYNQPIVVTTRINFTIHLI